MLDDSPVQVDRLGAGFSALIDDIAADLRSNSEDQSFSESVGWTNGNAVRCAVSELILPARVMESLDTLFDSSKFADCYSQPMDDDWSCGRDAESQMFEPEGWRGKSDSNGSV